MDSPSSADIFLFEGFRFDRRLGTLSRRDEHGGFAPLTMSSRALDILWMLVERRGDLVSRGEIFSTVWPEITVEESNLNVHIAALRRVLDEGRADGSCIQTIPGRGYRFVALVTCAAAAAPPPSPRSSGNGAAGPIGEQPASRNPAASSRSGNTPPALPPPQRRWLWLGSLGLVAGALCLITIVASNWHLPRPGAAGSAPRLSIVVLPFTDLSDDGDQPRLANSVTEDLTTELSLRSDIRVTSPNTAFAYGKRLVDTKQIGRELGVRYALEGGVERSGNRLRVNAQLIDTEKDAQVWAERFDRDADDLFTLQNEIASQLANALGVELIAAEAARPTEHPDAFDYILRGRAAQLKPNSHDVYVEAIGLFEHAFALDSQSLEAMSRLAGALVGRVDDQMTDLRTADADIARAEGLVDRALAASPRGWYVHFIKGKLLKVQTRYQEAMLEFERSLALNRNSVLPLNHLAQCRLFAGSIEEAIPLEEQAIRLSPRDPSIGWWYRVIGTVDQLQSRTNEAIVLLEKARRDIPAAPIVRAYLASAYGLKGEIGRAVAELAEARRLRGGNSYSSIAEMKSSRWWGSLSPKTRGLYEATYFAGLRKAGVPEE